MFSFSFYLRWDRDTDDQTLPHLSLILIFLPLHFHYTSCLSLFPRIRAAAPGMFMSYTMLTPCELLIIGEKHFSALIYTLGASMLALNTCFNLLPVLVVPLCQSQPWRIFLILFPCYFPSYQTSSAILLVNALFCTPSTSLLLTFLHYFSLDIHALSLPLPLPLSLSLSPSLSLSLSLSMSVCLSFFLSYSLKHTHIDSFPPLHHSFFFIWISYYHSQVCQLFETCVVDLNQVKLLQLSVPQGPEKHLFSLYFGDKHTTLQ